MTWRCPALTRTRAPSLSGRSRSATTILLAARAAAANFMCPCTIAVISAGDAWASDFSSEQISSM
jgi:hypothetical protein